LPANGSPHGAQQWVKAISKTFDYPDQSVRTPRNIQVASPFDRLTGQSFSSTYRVMSGNVIGYRGSEIKYAPYGTDRPALVATWLLKGLCRKELSRERKQAHS
jgi:hypothetical protein